MLANYIQEQILKALHFIPTSQQCKAVELLSKFVSSEHSHEIFILRGYAGTGKTSLVSAVVEVLCSCNNNIVLLAPTGRAAKVLSSYSHHPAYTIHKYIYMYDIRQMASSEWKMSEARRHLAFNREKNILFVVDEASMLDLYSGVLDDLISYVYSGEGCKLILLGDDAQLPPVGSSDSPALNAEMIRGYGLNVTEFVMTEVVRQDNESGILKNATRLRNILRQISDAPFSMSFPKITFGKDVINVPGAELVDTIAMSYDRVGIEETAIVCRSNKRANLYNQGIRAQILCYEEELEGGDILMIAKNNYYWSELSDKEDQKTPFLANGDIAVVGRARNQRTLYGFRFADCDLSFPDYDDMDITVTVLLDTLHADAPSLTSEQSELLYQRVMEDYYDIPRKQDKLKKLREDPYFNALQVKYAYAVTCHKAQGGQWNNVFIDQGYVTEEMLSEDYFRWLYTAFTRATKRVYLVNWTIHH
ncbi:MAG: AAA family ATPase [Bacteroidaceae bacterium]|nr:AAA family ATPase [Bacteroidaceae bacterium]